MDHALHQAIFKRKSIRRYDMSNLPQETLNTVMAFAEKTDPIAEGFEYAFTLLGSGDVKNLLPIKAPHYLCFYAHNQEGYLMNAGYLLQQVDLFLSSRDLGSCWLGLAKPGKDVPAVRNGMEFVIMLAFGRAAETVHRESTSEFRRKSLPEITDLKGLETLLEPVRLAPSASNTQSWFFTGSQEELLACRSKLNLVKGALYGKMNQVDMGIALCHLNLSMAQQEKHPVFDFIKSAAPAGYDFMAKVRVADGI